MTTIASILAALRSNTPSETDGCLTYRMFLPSERYVIDFDPLFGVEGWQQFDTNQDAHYFGCWVNPRTRMVLTYAEGDWSLEVAPSDDLYLEAVGRLVSFYGEGFIAKTIDQHGNMVVHRQDRQKFLRLQ